MKDYKKLNLPLLTEHDEEYQMLQEVSEEYTRQKVPKKAEKTHDYLRWVSVGKHYFVFPTSRLPSRYPQATVGGLSFSGECPSGAQVEVFYRVISDAIHR